MKENKGGKFNGIGFVVAIVVAGLGFVWWQISSTPAQAQGVSTTQLAVTEVAQVTESNLAQATNTTEAVATPAPAAEPVATPAPAPAPEATVSTPVTTETASAPATTSNSDVAPAALETSTTAPIPGSATEQPAITPPAVKKKTEAAEQRAAAAASEFSGVRVTGENYYQPALDAQGSEQSRLPVLFNVDFQTIYDDNIYISNSDRKADVIYRTSPTILFESTRLEKGEKAPTPVEANDVASQGPASWGTDQQVENYVRAGYTAIWSKYNKWSTNDSLDHNAVLFYRHSGDRSTFEASQTFSTFNGPNVDVQGTLSQTSYVSRLFGSYALTGKSTIELEAVQNFNRYETGFNTDEWVVSPYINYEVLPKVTLGLGCITGILNVDGGVNQRYQQPNIRALYQYGEKLNFIGRFGWEVREFNGSNTDRLSPVFSLASNWSPFDSTTLSVEGYRRTTPAISSDNQAYDATGASVQIKQRFLQKFYAAFRGTYEYSEYFFIPNGVDAGRNQDYFTLRPNIGWTPNEMLAFNIYYQYSESISSLNGNGFVDNQVGFQGSFSY